MDAFPQHHSPEQHVQTSQAPTSADLSTPLDRISQPMFEDGKPTPRLCHFLRGIALHIIGTHAPKHSIVVTPLKMLWFFEETEGTSETYPWRQIFGGGLDSASISVMYRRLRCEHHFVQPTETYWLEASNVPALTPDGFATFLTCLIRAHPDESFERLCKAVHIMPIDYPGIPTERFLREMSRDLLPARPDIVAVQSFVSSLAHESELLHLRDRQLVPPPPSSPLPIHLERQRNPHPQSSFSQPLPGDDDAKDTSAPVVPVESERTSYLAKGSGTDRESRLHASSSRSASLDSGPGKSLSLSDFARHRKESPKYNAVPGHSLPPPPAPFKHMRRGQATSAKPPRLNPLSALPLPSSAVGSLTVHKRVPHLYADNGAQRDRMAKDLGTILLSCEHMLSIVITAIDEPRIGPLKLHRNLERLTRKCGMRLNLEAEDEAHANVARAMQTFELSVMLVLELVTKADSSRSPSVTDEKDAQTDSQEGIDNEGTSEDEERTAEEKTLTDWAFADNIPLGAVIDHTMERFILESKAYHDLKRDMLGFVHKYYQRRIMRAITSASTAEAGSSLGQVSVRLKAREISWIPVTLFRFSHDRRLPIGEHVKAFVEDGLGESWDWWPFTQRVHRLQPGFCSLQWVSPQGTALALVIPETAKRSIQEVFQSSPAFINTAGPFRPSSWPTGTAGSSALTGNGPVTSVSSSGSTSSAPSSLPTRGTSGRLQQQVNPSLTPLPNTASQQGSLIPLPRLVKSQIHICVQSRSRQFVGVDCTRLKTDVELFAAMKTAYNKTRGWPRLWFSMWRYDCCEFVKFFKYGPGRCGRQDIGFPEPNDHTYDFAPRSPSPPPPIGPVLREEFHDHYYHKSCPSLYDWRRYQLQHRFGFSTFNDQALNAMPKRNVELELQDGKREHFYGLYAREQRSFIRVFAYACLFNIPGVIFFFLWLFQWGNGPDLQNASVPVMLSLSLTIGYASVIFGTREQR